MPGTPHNSRSSCSLSLGWRSSTMEPRSPCPALDMAAGGSSAGPVQILLERYEEDSVFCSGRTTAAPCQR